MKLLPLIFLLLLPVLASEAFAHGGEDHAHAEAPAAQVQDSGQSRIETVTESFELVGGLQGGALSVFVDRYETNAPVLDGRIEVELDGNVKAAGKFRPEHGDYVFDDARLTQALHAPGRHALVFTLAAGSDSDLLEGTLDVQGDVPAARKNGLPWTWAGAGLLAVLASIAVAAQRRRSRQAAEE